MRISDWSSDVCSSDLEPPEEIEAYPCWALLSPAAGWPKLASPVGSVSTRSAITSKAWALWLMCSFRGGFCSPTERKKPAASRNRRGAISALVAQAAHTKKIQRSEEHSVGKKRVNKG